MNAFARNAVTSVDTRMPVPIPEGWLRVSEVFKRATGARPRGKGITSRLLEGWWWPVIRGYRWLPTGE